MQAESIMLAVQVQPNASSNKVVRFKDGVLHLRIAAPPVKGQANQELLKFLSRILGVSKANLSIEKGLTSRRKTVAIRGIAPDQLLRQLEKY